KMITGPHLACASHAALDLVRHDENAVAASQLLQFTEESPRWNHVSAFALYRLDEDRGHFLGRHGSAKQDLLDLADRIAGMVFRWNAPWTAIGIGKGCVRHARHKRSKTFALHYLTCRERERAESTPVKAAEEGDEFFAPRLVARQFHGRL